MRAWMTEVCLKVIADQWSLDCEAVRECAALAERTGWLMDVGLADCACCRCYALAYTDELMMASLTALALRDGVPEVRRQMNADTAAGGWWVLTGVAPEFDGLVGLAVRSALAASAQYV